MRRWRLVGHPLPGLLHVRLREPGRSHPGAAGPPQGQRGHRAHPGRDGPPGASEAEDAELAADLLAAAKNTEEHAYAVASVRDALAPLCTELDIPSQPSLLKFANVHHLGTAVRGTLGPDRSVLFLAGELHPPAAVRGTPAETALELIRELEHMERGRYACLVGWVDAQGNGEFGIALRCAEVSGPAGPAVRRAAASSPGLIRSPRSPRPKSSSSRCARHWKAFNDAWMIVRGFRKPEEVPNPPSQPAPPVGSSSRERPSSGSRTPTRPTLAAVPAKESRQRPLTKGRPGASAAALVRGAPAAHGNSSQTKMARLAARTQPDSVPTGSAGVAERCTSGGLVVQW